MKTLSAVLLGLTLIFGRVTIIYADQIDAVESPSNLSELYRVPDQPKDITGQPASPSSGKTFKGDQMLHEYIMRIPNGSKVVSLSDEQLGRNFYSLFTIVRGIGSDAARSLREAFNVTETVTGFDLPDGSLVELCIQWQPSESCLTNDQIRPKSVPVSGKATDTFVTYSKKTIIDYVREIRSRRPRQLKTAYKVLLSGPCATTVPEIGEQKLTQKEFQFNLMPTRFEGTIVGSTIIIFTTRNFAESQPSRVLIGKLLDQTVELKGLNFDCSMIMSAF